MIAAGLGPHALEGLGLDHGDVAIVCSDPRWPGAFERIAEQIRSVLGDALDAVEHVGSTAVPGLVAKPILDIAVGLAPNTHLGGVIAALERWGFEYRGDNGDEGGHLFVLDARPHHRVAHVHVVERGDRCWRLYLTFRDRLRTDPVARDSYADVKRELAGRFPHDRRSYTASKAEFIRGLLGGDL